MKKSDKVEKSPNHRFFFKTGQLADLPTLTTLYLKTQFVPHYCPFLPFNSKENTIRRYNRYRLHVVIPVKLDYSDVNVRNAVEDLLTKIRNSAFMLTNRQDLEENWMKEFQIWNGGFVDG